MSSSKALIGCGYRHMTLPKYMKRSKRGSGRNNIWISLGFRSRALFRSYVSPHRSRGGAVCFTSTPLPAPYLPRHLPLTKASPPAPSAFLSFLSTLLSF